MAESLRKRLRTRCADIERHVRWRQLATIDELEEYQPGGKQNPKDGTTWPWIRWHSMLVAWLQRGEQVGTEAAEKPADDPAQRWAKADAAIIDALRSHPATMWLTQPLPDGRDHLRIYPKSFNALIECHGRHIAIQYLRDRRAVLLEHAVDPAAIALGQRAADEIVYQHRVCTWIACHETTDVPFAPDDTRPTVPAWVEAIDLVDIARALQTYVVVNALRLNYLDEMLKPDPEHKRVSWSVFMGTMAQHMHRPAAELFRDVPLAEILATAAMAAVPHQEAAEEIKRQRAEMDAAMKQRGA